MVENHISIYVKIQLPLNWSNSDFAKIMAKVTHYQPHSECLMRTYILTMQAQWVTLFLWIYACYCLHCNTTSPYMWGYGTTESCLLLPKYTLETAWCRFILGVTGQCWSQAPSNIFIRNMADLFLQSSSNSVQMMSLIHMLSIPIFPPSYILLAFPKNWNVLSLTGFMHIMQGGRSHIHNLLFCHYHGCITCISVAFPSHCDFYRNEYLTIYLCIYLLLICKFACTESIQRNSIYSTQTCLYTFHHRQSLNKDITTNLQLNRRERREVSDSKKTRNWKNGRKKGIYIFITQTHCL